MTESLTLDIRNLSVVYNANTSDEVIALKNFSLQVKQGEIIVITGGNGTGKSTLLKAISGAIPISSGQIFANGKEITDWNFIKRTELMSSVHQDTMLGTSPNLTLHENFQLINSKKWWLPSPYKLALTDEQIFNIQKIGLNLEKRALSKLNMFSGGQRQAIALCLAHENAKKILLLDEFTSSLDDTTSKNVMTYTFAEAKKEGTTILMVMHDTKPIEDFQFKQIFLK